MCHCLEGSVSNPATRASALISAFGLRHGRERGSLATRPSRIPGHPDTRIPGYPTPDTRHPTPDTRYPIPDTRYTILYYTILYYTILYYTPAPVSLYGLSSSNPHARALLQHGSTRVKVTVTAMMTMTPPSPSSSSSAASSSSSSSSSAASSSSSAAAAAAEADTIAAIMSGAPSTTWPCWWGAPQGTSFTRYCMT